MKQLYRWDENNGIIDVIAFIDFKILTDFSDLLTYEYLSDGQTVILKETSLAIWMSDICDYYGISLDEVFGKAPS